MRSKGHSGAALQMTRSRSCVRLKHPRKSSSINGVSAPCGANSPALRLRHRLAASAERLRKSHSKSVCSTTERDRCLLAIMFKERPGPKTKPTQIQEPGADYFCASLLSLFALRADLACILAATSTTKRPG